MLFAKPVYGDRKSTTSLIIRAKQLRNKRTGEVKVVSEIVGVASKLYTFNGENALFNTNFLKLNWFYFIYCLILGMIDFQYGPFEKISANFVGIISGDASDQDRFRIFYDQLLVKEPTRVLDSHLQTSNMPLFLPPLLFTRLDQPTMYCFSSRFRMNEYVELENNSQEHPYRKHHMISIVPPVNSKLEACITI